MVTPDPLSDMLKALVRAGIDPILSRRLVAEVRQRWTGQCYIQAVDRESRNAEVRQALAAGVPVKEVARRVQAHPATIRRIRREW